MRDFIYEALPSRVVFGLGSLERLDPELERLGLERVLVLSTPPQREQALQISERLGGKRVGIFDQALMHVPLETAQAARFEAARLAADGLLAVGGGSTIGLAKAIALESGLPIIAVPTTYAGSEMTPIWGLTEHGVKTTGRNLRVLPRTVIYDPSLTLSLPAAIAGPSGMNAIAHCVEALYAQDANPVTSLMAEEGIRALGAALPRVVSDPEDLVARSEALYGAWLAGSVLGAVGMALHHKLCHTLGGSFNLPHAEVHTVILPYATAYNREAAPEAMARICRALNCEDAAQGLYALAKRIGAPTALKAIGMAQEDIPRAAEIAVRKPYYNPCPVSREGIQALLQEAFEGRSPAAPIRKAAVVAEEHAD
jgi:maleylacetate reductase